MPKVIKPGARNQPEGIYIEVGSNGRRVDGGATIEIERGGIAANPEAEPGVDKEMI